MGSIGVVVIGLTNRFSHLFTINGLFIYLYTDYHNK
jgi:hypothetical protein